MAQCPVPASVVVQASRARACVLLLPLLHCLTACSPRAVDTVAPAAAPISTMDESITPREFIAALQTSNLDKIIVAANRIKRTAYQGELLPLLRRLWNADVEGLPPLDRNLIASKRLRIELADILIQADRNGSKDPQVAEYVRYARELVNDEDVDVARQAILVLGNLQDPSDMQRLKSSILLEDKATFRAAVNSFERICSVGEADVQQLAESVSGRDDSKSIVLQTWTALRQLRAETCKS